MADASTRFLQPTAVEKIFNGIFGMLVGLGFGGAHDYLLQVRGRKSGKLFSTPVHVLELDGKLYLVAPRGRTQWVRNAEAAGIITLKKGSRRLQARIVAIDDTKKPAILKAYLDRFRKTVQQYFPIAAGSPVEAFTAIRDQYPAFELIAES